MPFDLDLREQRRVSDALGRHRDSLDAAERKVEALASGSFAVAMVVLLGLAPPGAAGWHPVAAVACIAALIVASRAKFDIGSGFTVPTQVAFLPLLFVVPPSLVPPIVVLALMAAHLPDVVRGSLKPERLIRFVGSAWFTIGPAALLSVFPADSPSDLSIGLLAGLLGAQFAGDFAASAAAERMVYDVPVRRQLREGWVYGVDLALTPVGLLAAWQVVDEPWTVLAVVPVLLLLRVFSQERRGRIEGLVELNSAYRGTALLLSNVIEADDQYTGDHCRDVVVLALDVGDRLGLDDDSLRNLEFGALLHDVGKVAIPKSIINKPGRLDPDEWEIIKTHTVEGERMLNQVGGFMRQVGRIVRSHHERWDGAGYPDGLAGTDIPIEARIVSACDTWNAMTTTRSYRKAMDVDEAEGELRRCSGSQFDPAVVAALLLAVLPETRESDGLADVAAPRRAGRSVPVPAS